MDLELRHLRMVVAVAEQGSVTKAAASLGLSQPALSAQLNRIDRTLGGCVFTRDRHGARPTPLGELVLRHAKVLLPAMAALVEDTRRLVEERPGEAPLRVGTVGTAWGGLFLTHVAAALRGGTVTPATSWSVATAAARLASGTLDVALVGVCGSSAPSREGDVVWTRVCSDPVFALLPEHHPWASHPAVPLGALAQEVWLHAPGDDCFERCFVSACARAGFTPRGLGETDRASAVDQVRAGGAVALVQPVLLDQPGVRAVPIAESPLRWTHHVGWRRDLADHVDVEAVVHAARRAHDDAVARSPHYAAWLREGPGWRETAQVEVHSLRL